VICCWDEALLVIGVFFHDTDASDMEGNSWVDNGNGTFTTIEATARFNPLDQYLMGLRPASEVPDFFFIRNPSFQICSFDSFFFCRRSSPPEVGVTVSGTRQNVTINQIIASEGTRSPISGFTAVNPTTTWKQVFILLIPGGTTAPKGDVTKLDTIRSAWVTYFNTNTGNRGTINSAISVPAPTSDYDRDGRTDAAVYETATGNWFVVGSTSGFFTPALNFGGPGFTPVAADYDGDGITDAAVYESATGNWFVVGSTSGFFAPALNFGGSGFTLVPGDYDGDGRTDAAVYETATGNWFVVGSTSGFFTPALNFGGSGFTLVPGDYDGDRITDAAVYESATGNWFVVGSTSGFFTPALNFGGSGFTLVPGDYDGDGITDAAVYESATGNWFMVGSTSGFFTPVLNFGGSGFTPVIGDSALR